LAGNASYGDYLLLLLMAHNIWRLIYLF